MHPSLLKQRENHILPPIDDPRRLTRVEDQLNTLRSQGIQVSSAMNRISRVLEISNELTCKKLELTESKMEKTKASKLHPSVINMLRIIASVDSVEMPDSPADSIMEILNCETHAKAEIEMLHQFKQKGIKALFSIGFSKAIHDGKFVWASDEHPSNFSPFTVRLAKAGDQSIHNRHMFLSTFDSHGKSMTDDEIKKSLKQIIYVPESYHELVDQLEVFLAEVEIASGVESDMAHKVRLFIKNVIKENSTKIDALQQRNKEVCTYILFQLGLKCNNYLVKAESARSPEDISKNCLDFSALEDKITSMDISPVLPPAFKPTEKRKRDDEENEEDEKDKRGNPHKRGKKGKANLV